MDLLLWLSGAFVAGVGFGWTLCVIALRREIRLIRNMRPGNTVQAKRPF